MEHVNNGAAGQSCAENAMYIWHHCVVIHVIFCQYKYMKKDRDPHAKIEGKDAEDWMCIDFGMFDDLLLAVDYSA